MGFKPYSAGGSTHTGHEAVKTIMEKNRLTADMIDRIIIHATTATYHHTSWDYKPEGTTAAQMNMHYVVAVTALEGEAFIDQFSEEKTKDPKVIEFSRKVEVMADPELDKLGPQYRHTVIADVKTKDGRTFSERVETAKGSEKRPMTADEVVRKYQRLAGKVLPEKQIARIQDMVEHLEKVDNVNKLAKLLVP
jgi:aconitate decarboxylase